MFSHAHCRMAYISVWKTGKFTQWEAEASVWSQPKMPDPVPELALEPSVNQIRASSGNTESLFLQ